MNFPSVVSVYHSIWVFHTTVMSINEYRRINIGSTAQSCRQRGSLLKLEQTLQNFGEFVHPVGFLEGSIESIGYRMCHDRIVSIPA